MKRTTTHHLIPSSRCKELHIRDGSDKRNLREIDAESHGTWHHLFSNLTPYEVVQFLYTLFQLRLDQVYISKNREEWEMLFGHVSVPHACRIIAEEWTPDRSFYIPKVQSYETDFQIFFSETFGNYS